MEKKSGLQLLEKKRKEGKYVCFGLDTTPKKIPEYIQKKWMRNNRLDTAGATMHFNAAIINATRDIVCCYKYNLGFYLANGVQGMEALEGSIKALCRRNSSLGSVIFGLDAPVILDGKWGDVGSTCQEYARYAFERLGVDAITVSPYMGYEDGLDAFLQHTNKGIFVLCYTSNKGAAEFQGMDAGDMRERKNYARLYFAVADRAARVWNEHENCGLVMGASDPWAIKMIRIRVGPMPLLIPGIGAQGGNLEEAVRAALYTDPATKEISLPAIFNSSREVLYASSGEDFAEAARAKVEELNARIKKALKEAGA